MAVVLSAEQRELRSVVREFFAVRSCEERVRELMAGPTGADPATWEQLAGQLGLLGLAVPEVHGGAGATYVDLGILLEEAGRRLFGSALLSTALAAEAVLTCADDAACADLLPGLATGAQIGTVALLERPGGWADPAVATRATRQGDSWTLTGGKLHVPDGAASDVLVTTAQTDDGTAVFAVATSAPGVSMEPVPTVDQTRRQAHLTLDGAPARLLAAPPTAAAAITRTRAAAAVFLAAEQLGGAERVLELTVEHTLVRFQYGRAIGSFQAVKHLCADLATSLQSARSAVYAGLEALDTAAEDLPLAASAAKVFCSDTYTAVTAASIQLHGAIGTTWEHPAQLYFKRATSSAAQFGSPARHRQLLAVALGIEPATGDRR